MRFGACLSIIVLTAGSFLGVSASALADGACCTMSGCEPAADEAACTALGGFFLPGESCQDDACGAEVLASDVAFECTPLTVSFELEPGIYWLVAGAFEASDLAVCGARYTAQVTGLADECACPEDLDGNGAVGAFDLALLLGSWGKCPGCPADLDGNGEVEAFDLALLLGAWGPC